MEVCLHTWDVIECQYIWDFYGFLKDDVVADLFLENFKLIVTLLSTTEIKTNVICEVSSKQTVSNLIVEKLICARSRHLWESLSITVSLGGFLHFLCWEKIYSQQCPDYSLFNFLWQHNSYFFLFVFLMMNLFQSLVKRVFHFFLHAQGIYLCISC